MVEQMSVQDLKSKLDQNDELILVDCREQDENQFCKIEGSVLIPLSQFQDEFSKHLNKDQNIVVHCHHGGRSQKACEYLVSQGFEKVANLQSLF